MNLGTYLDQAVERYGDHPFLHFYDRTLTYEQFGKGVNQLANGLRDLGFKRGDFIHVWIQNSPKTLMAYFAIQKLGAIAGPINGLWKGHEVKYLLNDSQGCGLLMGSQFAPILEPIRADCPHLRTIVELGDRPQEPHHDFDELMAASSPALVVCSSEEKDPAYIFYTSGTTGHPKGVLLSHHNVIADIGCFQNAAQLDEGYRILIFLPLFHVNAMMTATSTLDKGGAVVLRKQFSAKEFWSVVDEYKVDFFSGVPAVYNILLNDPDRDKHNGSSLQFGICGAAPMPVETFKSFEKTFGVPIVEGYGLTEGTCVSTLNPRTGVRKVGSIGIPCPGQEVLVVGESGQELPTSERGELVVRGDVVMLGYHNKPEETAQALAGGVLHTGDVGYKDEDGYIFIVDRVKDMIIRGGENIYPKEIDCVLVEHPKVRDAACVGVPDEVRGEEVCAYVILKDGQTATERELIDFCKQRLADFKVPRYVKVMDGDFPRNAVGKVLKKEMKSWGTAGPSAA